MKMSEIKVGALLQTSAKCFYRSKGARRKKRVLVEIIKKAKSGKVLIKSMNYEMGTEIWVPAKELHPLPKGEDEPDDGQSLASALKAQI